MRPDSGLRPHNVTPPAVPRRDTAGGVRPSRRGEARKSNAVLYYREIEVGGVIRARSREEDKNGKEDAGGDPIAGVKHACSTSAERASANPCCVFARYPCILEDFLI